MTSDAVSRVAQAKLNINAKVGDVKVEDDTVGLIRPLEKVRLLRVHPWGGRGPTGLSSLPAVRLSS
jgi:hypothetical protein